MVLLFVIPARFAARRAKAGICSYVCQILAFARMTFSEKCVLATVLIIYQD